MQLKFTDSPELFRFCLSRMFSAIPAYATAIILFLVFCPTDLVIHPTWSFYFPVSFVFISFFYRLFFRIRSKRFLLDSETNGFIQNLPSLQNLFMAQAILAGIGWGWLFCSVISQVGAFRNETLFVYLMAYSICAASSPQYAVNKWLWASFLTLTVGIPAMYSVFLAPHDNFKLSIAFFASFLFIFKAGRATSEHSKILFEQKDLVNAQLEYFKSVIEAVPGLVTIFDGQLHYSLINSRVAEFTGISELKIIGQKLGFIHADEFAKLVRDFAESDQEYFQSRLQLQGAQGLRWFIVTLSRLADHQQIAAVSMDINNLMLAEQEAVNQRASAESSARLAAVGELAAGIAHEINNPLAVITAKAEQSIRKLQMRGLSELEPDLVKIRDTGFRIAKIVRGLKNLSRNGDGEPFISWKLSEVVQDVVSIFEAKLKSFSIKIEIDIPDDLDLECRPTQIGQVLLNLVSNSFDVLKNIPDSWIKIAAIINQDWVEISVTDSGPGIPEELRKKLMTPFFTTKAAGVGTGLGLSISRRIANDHQGTFYLDESCKNTRFVLKIPKKNLEKKAS